MRRGAAKLAYIHRRLWERDGPYRYAFLLGPPPLAGCVLALLLWVGWQALRPGAAAVPPAPWGQPHVPVILPSDAPPRPEKPAMALPAAAANGTLSGLVTGWLGSINSVEVSPALDVNVMPTPEATFRLDRTTIDASEVMRAGPPDGLFAGSEGGIFAVRTAGTYALSARVERFSQESADCIVRLAFAHHRLISTFEVNLNGLATRNFAPVVFDPQPGLYPIAAAFGCWRGGKVIGDATMTVLVRHPGEPDLRPARDGDILRPAGKTD